MKNFMVVLCILFSVSTFAETNCGKMEAEVQDASVQEKCFIKL